MSYALKIPRVDFSSVAIEQVTFIEPVPCTGITLNPDALTFEKAEETKTVTATVTPVGTTDILTWSSSNDNVATVVDGVVTIHGIGTAIISATCGEITESITVTQTTLKAEGTSILVDGKQIESSGTEPNKYLKLVTQTGQHSFGKTFTGNSKLAVGNGSANNYELFKVPYGATTAKVSIVEGTSMVLNYIFIASTIDMTTTGYGDLPKFVSSASFVNSETGASVEYGQAFGFRVDDNRLTATPSYVYFE